MIIRSKIESLSLQRKKLSISNNKSQFSLINQNQFGQLQQTKKQSIFNKLNQNQQKTCQIQNMQKQSKSQFSSVEKQNKYKKNSYSYHKNQILLSSYSPTNPNNLSVSKNLKLERQLSNKKLSNSKKLSKQNLLPLIQNTLTKNNLHNNNSDDRTMSHNYNNKQKNKFRISNLLNLDKRKESLQSSGGSKGKGDRTEENNMGTNNSSDGNYMGANSFFDEKSQIQNFSRLSTKANTCNVKRKRKSSIFSCKSVQFKNHKFTLISSIYDISINPYPRSTQKHSIAIQTIQQQKQFFQYLKYKRRQQQFQQQLEKKFNILQEIENDRLIYNRRINQLLNFSSQIPANQREKRVFCLRQEMLQIENKLEVLINEKCKAFEQYVVESEALEHFLQKDQENCIDIMEKYCKIIKQGFKQSQDDKFLRITQRLQNLILTHLASTKSHIITHIKSGSRFKQQPTQIQQTFKQYKKQISQYKCLLKNCFGHIKKLPELFYGLFGNQLPEMNLKQKQKFKNNNNQFEMPKCIDCFNSEWKFHMIIEKNILMQEIYKVVEELIR